MKLTKRSAAENAGPDSPTPGQAVPNETIEPAPASAGSRPAAVEVATVVARPRSRRLARPADDCVREGLLKGKKALVFGVANDHSIAWGIAKALYDQGADVGFSSMASLIKRRVRPLAASIGSTFVEACDVRDDAEIKHVFDRWKAREGNLDILVHAVAFAEKEDLVGHFADTSRNGFHTAFDISVYSLIAMAREARPYMKPGSSIMSMTYYGAEKVMPHYNIMGVAKAALEASTRYLAADLGPDGIRVNAISAGPIRTLSAHGIAGFRTMYSAFADVGFSSMASLIKRRVRPLAASIGATFVEGCDVRDDDEVKKVFERWHAKNGDLDILVHAVAYAEKEDLAGHFADTSRSGFHTAFDISVYSLIAMAREARPYMKPGSSIMTMTYYGAEKVVPHYNVMGVAKAALEATTRYLAADLGPTGIRVNAISAGPVRTLSAHGIAGFRTMHNAFADVTPLRSHITIEDVAGTAVYLASPLSGQTTGEVIYVDGGFNILGVPTPQV